MKTKLDYPTGKKERPAQAQNYRLTIGGLNTDRVTEISGMSLDAQMVDEPSFGIIGQRMPFRLPGTLSFGELTIKRPFRYAEKDWFTWVKQIRDGQEPNDYVKSGDIELLDMTMKNVLLTWTFAGAWASKWSISTFSTKGDDVVTEEMTLQIEHLERKKAS
jgi:phage tail-like protein